MRELDIGEVSRQSGLPVWTLRFYEEKGLIAAIGRRGLRRQFDAGVLERLALVALGRAAGFSLDDIARMFTPRGTRRRAPRGRTWKARPFAASCTTPRHAAPERGDQSAVCLGELWLITGRTSPRPREPSCSEFRLLLDVCNRFERLSRRSD